MKLALLILIVLIGLASCASTDVEIKGQIAGPGHYAGYVPRPAGATARVIWLF